MSPWETVPKDLCRGWSQEDKVCPLLTVSRVGALPASQPSAETQGCITGQLEVGTHPLLLNLALGPKVQGSLRDLAPG